jgi:signal transduction histidine kinase
MTTTPPSTLAILRRVALLAVLGVGVFALSYAATLFFRGTPGVTAFWPVNALVLAFILRARLTRLDGRLALAGAVAALTAANFAIGRSWEISTTFALANGVEIAVAAWFMRRIAMPLCGLRDLGQFLLGGVLAGPLASALLAALAMAVAAGLTGVELAGQAGAWLLADALGMAIVAPFALSLGSVKRGGWLKALAVPAGIGLICLALCWQRQAPIVFLAFPLVAWAVLNDRDRGGALGVGAVAIAVIGAALLGQGPIARLPHIGVDPGIALPVFFGALVLTAYPLAALLKELDVLAVALDRRRARAETDSAAKSELIGRVGEELRSPLTGVVTVAEMLRSGRLGELNARQRDLLARIAESGAEIEQLSREMVALGDGGRDLSVRASPVAEIVVEAAQAVRFRARRARVALEVSSGDPAWRAAIDPDRLRRLVTDALTGALDASAAGDAVRIVVDLDGEGRVRLVIEDAAVLGLVARQARFIQAIRAAPAENGVAFDRVELRRIGGDLRFGSGDLGGGQTALLLPRAADADTRAAA